MYFLWLSINLNERITCLLVIVSGVRLGVGGVEYTHLFWLSSWLLLSGLDGGSFKEAVSFLVVHFSGGASSLSLHGGDGSDWFSFDLFLFSVGSGLNVMEMVSFHLDIFS